MRLMDRFVDESQRMYPSSEITINRLILGDIVLSDGTVLPEVSCMLIAGRFSHPALDAELEIFMSYRFPDARSKEGQGRRWQHTSMNTKHLDFGYGEHGFSDRSFFSAEPKIALGFLLLNYDWKLDDAKDDPTFTTWGGGVDTMLAP